MLLCLCEYELMLEVPSVTAQKPPDSLSLCPLSPLPTSDASVTPPVVHLRGVLLKSLSFDCHSSLAFLTSPLCLLSAVSLGGASVFICVWTGGWEGGHSLSAFVSRALGGEQTRGKEGALARRSPKTEGDGSNRCTQSLCRLNFSFHLQCQS